MPASQHEYYIRQPSDNESRGPFTFAQLTTLADDKGVDNGTLYFDAENEQWVPIAGSNELGIILSKSGSSQTPWTDSKFVINATRILLGASAIALLISAFVTLQGGGVRAYTRSPLVWLGLIDVLLLVACSVFPTRLTRGLRMRAAFGLGLLGVLFWLQANIPALVGAAVIAVCFWLMSSFTTRRLLLGNVTVGLAALVLFTYSLVS